MTAELVRPGLIVALAQVANNDWRISFLAHTSDTAKEALDTVQRLEREITSLTAQLAKCREALDQSVKLQAHYAEVLNMHDGGERIVFKSADEWVQRLSALEQKS